LHKMIGVSGFKFPMNGRRLLLRGSVGFTLGAILGITLFSIVGLPRILEPWSGSTSHKTLLTFSSYEDLRDFLNRSANVTVFYYEGVRGTAVPLVTFAATGAELATKTSPPEYSRTNVQVEGVDEADFLKCDGEYIYLATDKGLIIVRAYPPENAKVLSRIIFNGTVVGLFINGDSLVVFETEYGPLICRSENVSPAKNESLGVIICPIIQEPKTHVWIYNVEEREKPILIREISVNGSYFTSRMIGNYVYLIVSQPANIVNGEVFLPVIEYGDHSEKVDASRIYYSNVSDYYYSFTTVLAVDVTNVKAPKSEVFLVGATSAVYVSADNIYVTTPKMLVLNEESSSVSEKTEIHRIRIADGEIKYEVSGVVPGRVLNQFSMDEYNGYFRIATTTGQLGWGPGEATSKNHVYVLNMDLNVTGRIEDIAPGESIYSARFMGERCYLVTFKKVDPFFVIDLSDPANPKILGKLKITGYSDYLHPYDENHIIGIGKEAVEAEEGDFAWYQGVKISLFDVSDVENPVEITPPFVIGDRGTDSPILWDHKALLFDKERNLLAIPVLVAEINEKQYPGGVPPNAYGDYVWQGVYVFNVSADVLTLRGRITHLKDAGDLLKSGYYFDSSYEVKRSIYIDDMLYTVSDRKVKINNLANLEEIGEVELP